MATDGLATRHEVLLAEAVDELFRSVQIVRSALVFEPGSPSRRDACKRAGAPLREAIERIVAVSQACMHETDPRPAGEIAGERGYDEA